MPLDIYLFFIDLKQRYNKEMHNLYFIFIVFRRANIQNFLWFDRVMTECSLFSVSPEIFIFSYVKSHIFTSLVVLGSKKVFQVLKLQVIRRKIIFILRKLYTLFVFSSFSKDLGLKFFFFFYFIQAFMRSSIYHNHCDREHLQPKKK